MHGQPAASLPRHSSGAWIRPRAQAAPGALLASSAQAADCDGLLRTPCFFFRSAFRALDMMTRRTDDGAVKCALRDFRRLLLTVLLNFIVAACTARRLVKNKRGRRAQPRKLQGAEKEQQNAEVISAR